MPYKSVFNGYGGSSVLFHSRERNVSHNVTLLTRDGLDLQMLDQVSDQYI